MTATVDDNFLHTGTGVRSNTYDISSIYQKNEIRSLICSFQKNSNKTSRLTQGQQLIKNKHFTQVLIYVFAEN